MAGTSIDNRARDFVFLSDLGENAFHLESFTGVEAVSELFDYEIFLLSLQGDLAADDLVGKPATLQIRLDAGRRTWIHGLVTSLAYEGKEDEFHRYRVHLAPWLAPLALNRNCRIFQDKTTQEVVEEVLKDSGLNGSWEFRLKGNYEPRPYCVQYEESDYEFICRLLEEEGIWFVFEHGQDEHKLVFLDDVTGWPEASEETKYRLRPTGTPGHGGFYVDDIRWSWRMAPGRYVGDDYNYESPSSDLRVAAGKDDAAEVYEWPGGFLKRDHGDRLARRRQEELAWQAEVGHVTAHGRNLRAGHVFQVSGVPRADLSDKDLVVLRAYHSARQGMPAAMDGGGGADEYRSSLDVILAGHPYRPLRRHPQPVVPGPQPAIVAGKRGEEIWTDKMGSVKVQFLWDRQGKFDEKSSCWVRCRQDVAGKGWGQLFIPRIGQEVLVGFVNGDPDRPVVLGSFYNEEHRPPFGPDSKPEVQGLRTHSLKKGGAKEYNEISFDDTKGKELLNIHGQRTVQVVAEGDELLQAGGTLSVACQDATIKVHGEKKENVDKGTEVKVAQGYKLDAMEVKISAKTKLVLECGANKIELSPGGVAINGILVRIN